MVYVLHDSAISCMGSGVEMRFDLSESFAINVLRDCQMNHPIK